MKQVTPLELLKETVDYYNNNNRGIRDGTKTSCAYLNSNGDMCAVGRCLTDEALETDEIQRRGQAIKIKDSKVTVDSLHEQFGISTLVKPQYKDISIEVWNGLQELHDGSSHWKDGKITECGEDFVEELKSLEYFQ